MNQNKLCRFAWCFLRVGALQGFILVVLAACSLVPVTGSDQQYIPETGFRQLKFEYQGQDVAFDLYVPTHYKRGWLMPLLVSIQAPDATTVQQEIVSSLSVGAEERGFLVLYLRSYDAARLWRYGQGEIGRQDLDFYQELMRHLYIAYDVDPSRIFLVGTGQGAEFSQAIACLFADQVAGVALIAGQYRTDFVCKPALPVSVIMIHGSDDEVMLYNGDGENYQSIPDAARGWAALNGCSLQPQVVYKSGSILVEGWSDCQQHVEVILLTVGGGRHVWPLVGSEPQDTLSPGVDANDLIWQFFLAHNRR